MTILSKKFFLRSLDQSRSIFWTFAGRVQKSDTWTTQGHNIYNYIRFYITCKDLDMDLINIFRNNIWPGKFGAYMVSQEHKVSSLWIELKLVFVLRLPYNRLPYNRRKGALQIFTSYQINVFSIIFWKQEYKSFILKVHGETVSSTRTGYQKTPTTDSNRLGRWNEEITGSGRT